ncbi:MAG: hypothetical protein GXZ08_06985 [Tissierellia bacterium]|nr:hypothetical protein [Tissierellia bacterium]
MNNYLKSEFYRITKTKTLSAFFKVIMVLIAVFSMMIFLGYKDVFKFININNPESDVVKLLETVFMLGSFLCFIIVDRIINTNISEKTQNNTVSSGISRTTMYISNLITSAITVIAFGFISIIFYLIASSILFGPSVIFSQTSMSIFRNFLSAYGNAMLLMIAIISMFQMFSYLMGDINKGRIVSVLFISLYPMIVDMMKGSTNLLFIILNRIELSLKIGQFSKFVDIFYGFDIETLLIAIGTIIASSMV